MVRAPFFKNIDSSRFPFGFGSDNHSGVHPRVLKTLELANLGFAPSYGTDLLTEEAIRIFREHFGAETEVHFCFNGTAANVLALAPLVRSHHSIVCSDSAHIHVDECAAPERLLGTKLTVVPVTEKHGAKLSPEKIEPFLIRRGDQHFAQIKAISITQPTELGTVYSKTEMNALREFCDRHGLWLHVDGARFINAAASLDLSLEDLSRGADSLSFGGTKNGLMFGEAVLFLSPRAREASKDFPFVRKQWMQLPSKTRFISAQFIELLGTDLWKEISQHAISQARRLREGLETLRAAHPGKIEFTQETQANAVFAIFESRLERALKKSAFFYVWNEHTREVRLMTSWASSRADIDVFLDQAQRHLETSESL